jgi:thiol:disulfide interchange protein DsbD
VAGGAWLGFLEKSASPRPAFRTFQRLAGALAIAAGVALVAGAQRPGLTFEPLSSDAAALRAPDQPYAIDFSADWCQPCHELERVTFTDARVRDAMKGFRLYKVDLTRYDSPEAESWRRRFGILGVPTIVFARPHGAEVREARVEGFLPPEAFLRRVALARGAVAEVPGANPASAAPAAR